MTMYLSNRHLHPTGYEPAEFIEPPTAVPVADLSPGEAVPGAPAGPAIKQEPHADRTDRRRQVVQELIDEHVHVSCDLVPIDGQTWAIHGSIAYEGEVIVAEFQDQADAEAALMELAASENPLG
jgi:hypothetical protein